MQSRRKSDIMKQDLLVRICSGELSAGAKLPSISELAGEYQVSYVTAHKVLAGLEQEGLLTCRNGVGTFVQDRDRRVKISRLAVPFRLRSNPIFACFFEEILKASARNGIPVVFGGESESETVFLEEAVSGGCDAVIRFPGAGADEHKVYELLRRYSLRTVVLNDWWQEGAGVFPCVRSDEAHAAEILLEHMHELGHDRIALVQEAFFAQRCELLKAFYRWHYRHGLQVLPQALVFTGNFRNNLEMIRQLKKDGFTAVLFSYDLLAIKTLELLEAVEPELKDSFCIAGMDDIPEAEKLGLTSFRHDIPRIVDEAFRILQTQDYDLHDVRVIPGTCIFRTSTLERAAEKIPGIGN